MYSNPDDVGTFLNFKDRVQNLKQQFLYHAWPRKFKKLFELSDCASGLLTTLVDCRYCRKVVLPCPIKDFSPRSMWFQTAWFHGERPLGTIQVFLIYDFIRVSPLMYLCVYFVVHHMPLESTPRPFLNGGHDRVPPLGNTLNT